MKLDSNTFFSLVTALNVVSALNKIKFKSYKLSFPQKLYPFSYTIALAVLRYKYSKYIHTQVSINIYMTHAITCSLLSQCQVTSRSSNPIQSYPQQPSSRSPLFQDQIKLPQEWLSQTLNLQFFKCNYLCKLRWVIVFISRAPIHNDKQ